MKKKITIYDNRGDCKTDIIVLIDTESIVEKEYWINGVEFSEEELEKLVKHIQEAIQTANKKDY